MKRVFPYLKEFFKRADMLLLGLCLACALFGIVMISSATASYHSARYLIVQIGAMIIGVGLYVVLTVIDLDILADKWKYLAAFSVAFLLLLIPFGVSDNTGNTGWLRFFGIGIQPTEVVKVIFIILLAKQLTYLKNYRDISAPLSIVQLGLHFAFMFGLILVVSQDLGSALIFLFIFIVMLFAAGVKLYWFLLGVSAVAVATPFLWSNFFTDRQKERILAPYVASIDPEHIDVKWQPYHSKLALASGQMTGSGLYQGTQSQQDALVGKHTDFIFAVIGEELGMVGCCVVILLLAAIMIRCVYVGVHSNSTMGMLVCTGCAAFLFFQTFENIGMCIGITPVVGITLPFFSYGGSSLFSTFAAMGVVSGVRFRPKPVRFQRY